MHFKISFEPITISPSFSLLNFCILIGLLKKGITISAEGELTAEQIDQGMLIDQHYYAIASKATLTKPDKLPVPADKFEKEFGLSWTKALEDGVVFNALDACKVLGVDASGLDKLWGPAKKVQQTKLAFSYTT